MKTNLKEHLRAEHGVSGVSTYLREIVYGGNDGIVTTFAVVAGFSGATLYGATPFVGTAAVLLFGLANLFADATAMGLGNFLSSRSERDLYFWHRKKELQEIKQNERFEEEETRELLKKRGVSGTDIEGFITLYKNNPDLWADFMMQYELEIPDPRGASAAREALATFASFIFFGSIPLLPYFFGFAGKESFYISIAATFLALLLLGMLRFIVTRRSLLKSIAETLIIGGTCALVAYVVGVMFRV